METVLHCVDWTFATLLQRKERFSTGATDNSSTLCIMCSRYLGKSKPYACVYTQNAAAAPAINVSHGVCEIAKDYQKKKNALRLKYVAITD